MLYHLVHWLESNGTHIPGSGAFLGTTTRVMLAVLLSLFITTVYGKTLIRYLQKKQIGESVRELGLAGENLKKGTPTMGGIIIILAILIPTLVFANLEKVYVRLMIFSTIWLGVIGFIDDYLKLRAKKMAQAQGGAYKKSDKDGLAGWFKIFGQVALGITVGATLWFNGSVKTWREYQGSNPPPGHHQTQINGKDRVYVDAKEVITTIPFVKGHEFNYGRLLPRGLREYAWVLYIAIVILIVTAVSNGANLTDGLDGLAAGTSAIISLALGVFAYASSSLLVADYLNIMYIPNLGELAIFIGAMIGACVGFLWYNSFPAQVFMGDTGSLTLGGLIAALAIIVHKELLIPIFCGVFLVENLSVMLQVGYFKYTKRKYGEGRRIFLMSPLHHHYQKKGYHEVKIVTRFWIVTLLCVVFSIVTLKLR
ncbi:phospho-N-acetylmuramoyl-pentapeptide-transferase [Flaviaesturariibacter amylovorans]|uniref:Phospho-N-acetylmuramoyl-pentapeptide-transferase n=1 Tax=Flaviaesturariibacter amylovorans TaxID=1084520 RepID=A0ABP8HCN2_9BACT